jgi:hypothetical protein
MMFSIQSGQLGHSTNTIILKSNEHKSYAWVFDVICTFQSSQFFERLSMHFGVVDHIRASALTTADRRPPSISKFVSKNQKDWDLYLPYLMMAYRSSVHDAMGETPCFMMMGREVTLPIDLVFGKHTDQEPKSLPDYVEDFINRIEKVHEVVGGHYVQKIYKPSLNRVNKDPSLFGS